MKILVTGAAGFIGSHLCQRLLARGDHVVGLDNLNNYYDVGLKKARLERLTQSDHAPHFQFVLGDLCDQKKMADLFSEQQFTHVMNLAAQAGVRYSIENPKAYIESNLDGFINLLQGCRETNVSHLVYASSSSVYGANTTMPFSVQHNVDHPLSIYAATKKANELMAHSYSHLFSLPTTGLRFFTVYGPWGRPDMALFLFTRKILAGEPIDVFNNGHHKRDFTYIDDIVEGVIRVLDRTPTPNPNWSADQADAAASSHAPYRLYNIGNNQPVELMHYINTLESVLGKKAIMNMLPLQPGDVPDTYADVSELEKDVGFKPQTTVQEGIERFVAWYLDYYTPKNR